MEDKFQFGLWHSRITHSCAAPSSFGSAVPRRAMSAVRSICPGWIPFPTNHFKNWLFLSVACRIFTRMAAKLRPTWRQTTLPERAGEYPTCNAKKQHNFLTGLQEKESSPGRRDERRTWPCAGLQNRRTRERRRNAGARP